MAINRSRSNSVRLVSFCAPADPFAAEADAEQAQLAASLARHQIQAQQCLRDRDVDAGGAILTMVDEIGADLLVMGCYGHSRLRELLLGGVTRTMLQAATVPVLMAR